jgi:hypothetical protein
VRIAALYDVHGNLPALEAVLEEVEGEQPVSAAISYRARSRTKRWR